MPTIRRKKQAQGTTIDAQGSIRLPNGKPGFLTAEGNNFRALRGDCIELLKQLPENSIDSCVVDPPYGIGFMGKEFDTFTSTVEKTAKSAGGFGKNNPTNENAYAAARVRYSKDLASNLAFHAWCRTWVREVYRVLKPGGFILAFGGSRTYQWLATAIELEGFEVRDSIAWMFGSGFPKSQDISKQIDKQAGAQRKKVKATGQIGWQRNIGNTRPYMDNPDHESDSCEPVTAAAAAWQGWGTAIKPGHEPIIQAQKPFSAVPFCGIIASTTLLLEALLWWKSPVKFAKACLGLNLAELNEESNTVRWIVGALSIIESLSESEVMDMFKSQEEGLTLLNIVLSWNNILDVLSDPQNTYTIETKREIITSLQILNSWISATIPESIIKDVTQNAGLWLRVSSVKPNSSVLKNGLKRILLPSVQEPATTHLMRGILTTFVSVADANSSLLQVTNRDTVPKVVIIEENQKKIVMARKPLSEKTVAANVLKWGTGGINIDASRVGRGSNDLSGWHKSGADGSKGYQETDTYRIRPITAEEIQERCSGGRFPANVILSHSEACTDICAEGCPVAQLDRQSGKSQSLRNAGRNGADQPVNTWGLNRKEDTVRGYTDSGGASRFFKTFGPEEHLFQYQAKPSKREKDAGLDAFEEKAWVQFQTANGTSGKASSISAGRDTKRRNTHPTLKPVKLMQYLIQLVTPPGGTVLDCMMGSGTTGVAAIGLGYQFIGIEKCTKDFEYFPICVARLKHAEKTYPASSSVSNPTKEKRLRTLVRKRVLRQLQTTESLPDTAGRGKPTIRKRKRIPT